MPDGSEGIETQLCLRPCSEKELDKKGWYEFEICSGASGSQDTWIVNCKGYVSVETVAAEKARVRARKSDLRVDKFFVPGQRVVEIDPESIWADGRRMSLYHGPQFRNLVKCQATGPKVVTEFKVGDVVTNVEPYILHPTTLDSIIQTVFGGLDASTKKDAMVVPRNIGSLFIPRNLKRNARDKLIAFTDIKKPDRRGVEANIAATNSENTDAMPPFQMKSLYCQSVPREVATEDTKDLRMCAVARWEPDVLHNIPETFKQDMRHNLKEEEIDFERRMVQVSYNYIHDAVTGLGDIDVTTLPWHLKIFYNWMKDVDQQGQQGKLARGSERWAKASKGLKQSIADATAAENSAGSLTCTVGANLEAIVRQKIVPIELMLQDNLLNRYYGEIHRLEARSYKHLRSILETYSVKYPSAKILEIGAGTGSATAIALEAFSAKSEGGSGTLIGTYDFTDVSAGFFEPAKEKFSGWAHVMDFKVLDIGTAPAKQSFATGMYDLILASQVLHATPNLQKTLSHVRSLLKPHGKLIMIETTQDRLDMQLIFGTLEGWWLSEEPERKQSPNAPLSFWDKTLKAAGFTGVDLEIGDCEEDEFQSISLVMSTAYQEPSVPTSITIVHDEVAPPQEWLNRLKASIQGHTSSVPSVETLSNVVPQEDRTYIVICEMEGPLTDKLDRSRFEQLRKLLVMSQGILWVSCGGIMNATNTSYATSQGLLRTLKQEDAKRVVQLDLESSGHKWNEESIQHIAHVFRNSFDHNINPQDIEWEYAVKSSPLHAPGV